MYAIEQHVKRDRILDPHHEGLCSPAIQHIAGEGKFRMWPPLSDWRGPTP
jgi:hypothetical protein